MQRTRIKLGTYVNLDMVPGTFHTAESARNVVQSILNDAIGHYTPSVSIESYDTSKEHGEPPSTVVVKRHETDSWNAGPPVFCVVASSEGAAKAWIQDEVDGKHDDSGHRYAQGKDADWWLKYGTFSITPVEVV